MSNISSFISKKSYRNANGSRRDETAPYKMDTYSLDGASLPNCRLEYGNGIFYPETENDSDSKVRIFNDLMAYAMRKNDYNTGTQLNLANCNSLFPLIYFDLTYQTEKVTRDPKQLNTGYQPMQLRISMSVLLFSLKRSLKLIRLVMSWLLCNTLLYYTEDMTQLYEIKVKLSENEKRNLSDLSRAFHQRETIVLRLASNALSGSDTLYVPSNIVETKQHHPNCLKNLLFESLFL